MLEEAIRSDKEIVSLDMCINTEISTLVKSAICTRCLKKSLDQSR